MRRPSQLTCLPPLALPPGQTCCSECLSSPSLAVSCSLSLSLGSPALNTNDSKPLPPLPPGSPVTLQPLPQGRLVSATAAGAVGPAGSGAAWWSPGAARAQQQEQQQGEVHDELARSNQEERQQEMPLEHEKQLLAEAGPLVAGDPGPADSAAPEAAAAASSGEGPSSAEQPSAARSSGSGQRRCRSPFLARDCSCVDVWTPDRYARWVGEQLGPGGEEPGGRRRCSPPGDSSPAPAGSAGFRWRDYVDAVEAAQMGVSWDQAGAGSAAGAAGSREGGGGMGLRGALKSVLGWVAGRLGPSHPIELTPSELGSYGSAHSSPVGTPYSGSPDVAGGSHSRYFTPASEGPGDGGTALHVAGAGRRESSSAGLRWRLGEAAEESPADGDSTAAAGDAAGAWRGARTLSYGGSEGGSGGGSSAGSCSCSPNHEDDEGHAVQGSAERRARRGSMSSRDSTNSAAAAAAAAPPPPAHDRGHLAAVRAPLQQLRCSSGGTSSSRGSDGRPDQQQLRCHDGAKPAQCSGTGGKDWAAPVDQGNATGAGGGPLAAEDSDERLYHTPPCCSPQKAPAAAVVVTEEQQQP